MVDMLKKMNKHLPHSCKSNDVELLMLFGKLRVSWNLENSNWVFPKIEVSQKWMACNGKPY